jgi:metal-dependent amidase/aminoacylase/carboxypeptidase family protein
VKQLTGPDAARDKVVARAKELMNTELLGQGDDITKDPEVASQETRAVERLTKYLGERGFETEQGIAGLRIARATGPTLGVVLEYDALRGTKGAFHDDQHSTQGSIGLRRRLR